jgi:Tol biopolymer transport system component
LSWSPDGKWIALVNGNGEAVTPGASFGNLAPSTVMLVPAAAGAPIAITGDKEVNESPVWSPDSRRLFFISNRDGPSDVYVQEIASSGTPRGAPTRLTTGLDAQSISLSADGTRLAYNVYTARANIWSLPIPSAGPVTTENATQVTTGNQVIESMRVSADGQWLVYDSDLRGNADIYRVKIDGTGVQQLTSEPWDEFAPDLSPDGRMVAYHSFRSGTRDIEVKALDGSPAERVTDSPRQESYPIWSPDGTRLLIFDQAEPYAALVSARTGPGRWSVPDTIGFGMRAPAWSPDGLQIAYGAMDSTGGTPVGALYTMTLASHRTRLVHRFQDLNARGLYWARDGQLYLKDHDAQGRAFIARITDDGRAIPLVRFTDLNRTSNRADFAASADHFYFTFEQRESDVFVVEVERQ